MTLYKGADAAFPGFSLPPDTQILAAYVGIPGNHGPDTPHIWTAREWNSYIEQHHYLRSLPIYVHNYPDATPSEDADNAVQACLNLGWDANEPGKQRRIIAVDLEVMVDYNWVETLLDEIEKRGFTGMSYGSAHYVKQNPTGDVGYWEANYIAHAPSVLPPNVGGMQWHNGNIWDFDVFSQEVYDGCGIGLRHE